MHFFKKSFLVLLLFASPILAFDNEIVIRGKVIEGVTIDILTLSERKDSIYLFSNSKTGVQITVKEITNHKKKSIKNILNNGVVFPLPAVYRVFKSSCFLGTPGVCIDNIVLGVDISVQ